MRISIGTLRSEGRSLVVDAETFDDSGVAYPIAQVSLKQTSEGIEPGAVHWTPSPGASPAHDTHQILDLVRGFIAKHEGKLWEHFDRLPK